MKFLVSLLVSVVLVLSASSLTSPNYNGISGSYTVPLTRAGLDVAAADSAAAFVGYKRHDREISDHYGNPEGFTHYIIRVPPIFV